MKYYIQRELNEYGPYTLADLQRYVAQGSILVTDLTRSEGMTDWVPVSQVIGNIPVPVPSPQVPMSGVPGEAALYGGAAYGAATAPALAAFPFPNPPNFHWVLVLVLSLLTRGLFSDIWLIVEASWVRKVTNSTKDIFLAVGALASMFAGLVLLVAGDGTDVAPMMALGWVLLLGSLVLRIVAVFSIRSSIQDHYNTAEPINLSLSGVMTFFFGAIYFQYHFNQINSWKKTSGLGLGI
jgi:uncharacterized protein DUF4339